MCLADAIKEGRRTNGISQAELARKLNVSQPVISMIENEQMSAPMDLLHKIPEVLDDACLKAEISFSAGVEFFNVPTLKHVDDNPKNVLEVLIEEMSEALQSIQAIKRLLKNAKPGQELDENAKSKVYEHEEQIADLYAALKMHFITMDRAYGIKLKDIEIRINHKLKRKGYV
ncbi:MAG: helix-turn-helix domain-containing protein [Bacillota bacterium]